MVDFIPLRRRSADATSCARKPSARVIVAALMASSAVCLYPAGARADLPSSCFADAGFNEMTASDSALQACGLTRVLLSDTQALPGGGKLYQYALPNGEVVSYPATPSGFNALTATPQEDAAYEIAPPPPTVSTAYSTWESTYANWDLNPGASPFIILGANSSALRQPAASPLTAPNNPEPSSNWSGYIVNGSGWTRSETDYTEPTLGSTSCSGSSVSFWTGIGGKNSDALGQDGTLSGAGGFPDHSAFFEALPGNEVQFQNGGGEVLAPAGSSVKAVTTYAGDNSYQFVIYINGTGYAAQEGGANGYDGSTADTIVERTTQGSNPTPLLNFQHITMAGYNGTGRGAIGNGNYNSVFLQPHNGAYDTVGGVSGASFGVTQNSCKGAG